MSAVKVTLRFEANGQIVEKTVEAEFVPKNYVQPTKENTEMELALFIQGLLRGLENKQQ